MVDATPQKASCGLGTLGVNQLGMNVAKVQTRIGVLHFPSNPPTSHPRAKRGKTSRAHAGPPLTLISPPFPANHCWGT